MSRSSFIRRLRPMLLIALAATSLLFGQTALGAVSFGQPVLGQHIYDRAGVLTLDQVSMLEQHAMAVAAAGAPVIVYLQAKNASYSQTEQDARDLMDQWNVQSAPDAHDGLVVLFNLKPNDLHHGQFTIFAGQTHYNGGNLPAYELQHIANNVMKPDLVKGDLAQGIAAGLDAAASSLRNGPAPAPRRGAADRFASGISAGPFSVVNVLSVILTAIFAWFTLRIWRTRPRLNVPLAATTSLPDSTPPAVVGAVLTGRVRDQQFEAMILDLAHRGALVIESGAKKNDAQVRLLDESKAASDVERQLWSSLETRADENNVVSRANLARARSSWAGARALLRKQLVDSGLYDPNARLRRRPVLLASAAMFLLAVAPSVVGIMEQQPWAFAGSGVLGAAALVSLIAMSAYPDTSIAGAELAATWSSYMAGIKRSKSDRSLDVNLDLDEAMPYAVAAGVTSSLSKRLKAAAEEGYIPVWLGPSFSRNDTAGNAYI